MKALTKRVKAGLNEAGIHLLGLDKKFLKVGDTVIWRGGWGKNAPQDAVITGIRKDCYVGKETMVERVPWSDCSDRDVIVWMDNGFWAYGFQLERKVSHVN